MSKDKTSNDRQEIARKIRDGSYFSDANNWYALKYLYPITDRSMAFIFAVATIVGLIPMIFLLETMAMSNEKVAFPMYVADSIDHFSVIKPLIKDEETAQEAVARYLIEDYVTTREEYIYGTMNSEKVKRLLKKIKSSSTKQILNEYTAYISENNPRSPLIIYKDHTNRLITIKSLSFLDNDQTSGKAKVNFEVTEQSKDGKTKSRLWEATINYKLPDVETIAKSGVPLRFVVSYYRTKPLGAITESEAAKTAETKPAKAAEEAKKPEAAKTSATEPAKVVTGEPNKAITSEPAKAVTQEPVKTTTPAPTNQKK